MVMDTFDHSVHTALPPRSSVLSYIATSAALLVLAILIQSDSFLVKWLAQHLWSTPIAMPSPSSVALDAGRTPTPGSSKRTRKVQPQSQSQSTVPSQPPPTSPPTKNQTKKSTRHRRKASAATNTLDARSGGTSVQPTKPPTSSHRRATAKPKPSPKQNPRSPADPSPAKATTVIPPTDAAPTPEPFPDLPPSPISSLSAPRANRSLSQSILKSILNPRAAAYEYRARYYNPAELSPNDSPALTTTDTETSSAPPSPETPVDDTQTRDYDVPSLPQDTPEAPRTKVKQPFDYFLVLDVEATCAQGAGFDYPNEIIEWPVVLMKWVDKDEDGRSSELVIVDEFRSFVKPTWRPELTEFCTMLTGITQTDIDSAPTFPDVLADFERFLQKHDLLSPPVALLTPPASRCSSPAPAEATPLPIPSPASPYSSYASSAASSYSASSPATSSMSLSPPSTSPATSPTYLSPALSTTALPCPSQAFSPRMFSNLFEVLGDGASGPPSFHFRTRDEEQPQPKFAWATDGPFDLRDFLVKQCFISQIPIPEYFLGDNVIDVRKVVGNWFVQGSETPSSSFHRTHHKRVSLNIAQQLQALSLGSFAGRQHSGIDDARNIGRIIHALAQRAVRLEANTYIQPNRRWYWMGSKLGEVVMPPASISDVVVPPSPEPSTPTSAGPPSPE